MSTLRTQRLLPYSVEELYAAIADVTSYPSFLPWCQTITILSPLHPAEHPGPDHLLQSMPWLAEQASEEMLVRMEVQYKIWRASYVSRVTLYPPHLTPHQRQSACITAVAEDGPLRYLRHDWKLMEYAPSGMAPPPFPKTEIAIAIDVQWQSGVLQAMFQAVFHRATQRVMQAFEARIQQLYGVRPLIP